MRNLPPTIEITGTTTVEDAKKHVAKAIGMRDFNRIAILEPTKQSIIKNRKALLKDEVTVMQSGEIMVKDLGSSFSLICVLCDTDSRVARSTNLLENSLPHRVHWSNNNSRSDPPRSSYPLLSSSNYSASFDIPISYRSHDHSSFRQARIRNPLYP